MGRRDLSIVTGLTPDGPIMAPATRGTLGCRTLRYVSGMPEPSANPPALAAGTGSGGIYLIAAHPNWRESRANRRLRDAAQTIATVQVCDLYERYPDYDIDVAAEQERLARAQLLVLMHPIQWYSMPPLQKLWLDEVLTYGWAYGVGGTALRGKDLWLLASTGGQSQSYHPKGYNRYFFDAFLPPYEQTAALCGMRFLPPLVLHGAHAVRETELAEHVDLVRQRLASYPGWPEIDAIDPCPECAVPPIDRPAEPAPAGDAA